MKMPKKSMMQRIERFMLIKLSITNEMLPEVQTEDDAFTIW
jgi:hypothetical protein